jgi:hypothetical protein
MNRSAQRTATGSTLKLDVVIASLLLNAGILLALVTWITADPLGRWSWISDEQVRTIVSIAATGLPVTILASLSGRLIGRLPVDLGTGTLLALITSLSALFTTAAALHTALPWDSSEGVRLFHSIINGGTIFLMARILARRARHDPDWLSITGAVFAVGLLPLGLTSLMFELISMPTLLSPYGEVQPINVASAALSLVALLPALFFGRALLRAESARYRPVERRYVDVFAAFGVGALAAFVVPIATSRLYGTLTSCTNEYVCTAPPGEWIVIGLLTGLTAWRLIRGAEAAKQPLLWIGALPPLVTTAIALNWYLPAWLGGLPIAGALIAFGGLLLLRRATMKPAPRSRRASRGR